MFTPFGTTDFIPATPSGENAENPIGTAIRSIAAFIVKEEQYFDKKMQHVDGIGWRYIKKGANALWESHKNSREIDRQNAIQRQTERNAVDEEYLPKRGRVIIRNWRMSDGSISQRPQYIATIAEKTMQLATITLLVGSAVAFAIGFTENSSKPESERFGTGHIDHIAEDFGTGGKEMINAARSGWKWAVDSVLHSDQQP